MEKKQSYKCSQTEKEKEAAYFKARKAESEKWIDEEVAKAEAIERMYEKGDDR